MQHYQMSEPLQLAFLYVEEQRLYSGTFQMTELLTIFLTSRLPAEDNELTP